MNDDDFDEDFIRECLNEVRDGETVTIQTTVAPRKIEAALRKIGATEEEIGRIELVSPR